MGDQKLQKYIQVKSLVLKGVTSPSVVQREIPAIKQWKTARKYVEQALLEIKASATDTQEREYMIEILKEHRSELASKLAHTEHLNQYIGGLKQLLAVNSQLIQLMPSASSSSKPNTLVDFIKQHYPIDRDRY